MTNLSHFDSSGASRMVDVGSKDSTQRRAIAEGVVEMLPATLQIIRDLRVSKGNVCEVARLAGIMAAKQTHMLIPLCHPLNLEAIEIRFDYPASHLLRIEAEVRVAGKTGVEMEALTAVSVAALTVYDMCKSIDRAMVLGPIRLLEKSGGKRGHYVASPGVSSQAPEGEKDGDRAS